MARLGAYGALGVSPLHELLRVTRAIRDTPSPKLIGALVNSHEDVLLLDEIERASFTFFWEQMDPTTGIVKDRCLATGENDPRTIGSTGATGFGLTAMCIGAMRGFVKPDD